MERKTADLQSYIVKIYFGHDYQFRGPIFDPIFDYGITHRPPVLTSGRTNRILVYPGSFNPPHLGHQELLRHGFSRNGGDLNIIAAIVVPLDDERLASKFRDQPDTRIFTQAQRVRLWKDHAPSDWYWVYGGNQEGWYTFQNRLAEDIVQDGFDIKFICLCGPDYVEVNRPPPIHIWGCKEFLVSDIGRPADFTNGDLNCLTTLKGYKPWKEVSLDHENMWKRVEEDLNWIFSGVAILSPSYVQIMLDDGEYCSGKLE
jgi:hypothetical protein